jgi:HAD superfamily hydrolase (TIGR01509 family)
MNLHGLEGDAVLFDCDGVLVDSEPLSWMAWSTTMAAHGAVLDEGRYRALIGGTEAMVAARFGPEVGADPESLEREARRAFDGMVGEAKAYEDALDLVDRLEAANVPIAVATNGLRWRLDSLLTAVGLDRLLPNSVTADEVAHPKPAPDLYEKAARVVGVPPDRCLVIEDSPTGVAAAGAAGCKVIAVDRGMFERSQLIGAEVIVDRV